MQSWYIRWSSRSLVAERLSGRNGRAESTRVKLKCVSGLGCSTASNYIYTQDLNGKQTALSKSLWVIVESTSALHA